MKNQKTLFTAALTMLAVSGVQADTLFSTTFDYVADPVLASGDSVSKLNGAIGQVGTWDGTASVPASTTFGIEAAANHLILDQPDADVLLQTELTSAMLLDGTGTYSFDFKWRRTAANSAKDTSVIGYDSSGVELFHLVFTANNADRSIGVDNGTVDFDLPGVIENDNYLNAVNDGGGSANALENVSLSFASTGFTISFDGTDAGEDFTTSLISYTGAGTNLAYVDFDVPGSTDNALAAGFRLDNIAAVGNPVPEPGSLALVGLGGLCLLRRRRAS